MLSKMIRFIFLLVFTTSSAAVTGTALHSSSGPHIANVNILLPPKMTNPVEYRLQGSDGCFQWSWDHHEILSVLPEYNVTNHCSTSARLRSIAPYSGRKETAVYARDVNTGIVIRCMVFIDNSDRIQFFHNSIKLDLDGLATLRVRAFDTEGCAKASSDYKWFSSDTTVVSVTTYGVVQAKRPGKATVKVVSSFDSFNYDEFQFLPIWLCCKTSLLRLLCCYNENIKRLCHIPESFGGYWVNTAGAEAGNQVEDQVYLVPGTQLDVMLQGGPERWDKGVDFLETVEIFDEKHAYGNGVLVDQISSSLHRLLCQTLGTFNHDIFAQWFLTVQKLVFKRGNLVGDDHPLPTLVEASFSSSIVVIVDEPVNDRGVIQTAIQADRSPGQIQVTPVTVANGQTIRVAAVSISTNGEPFANASSLCLGDCDSLAYWNHSFDSENYNKSSWERFRVLQNEPGSCIVRATVTGFFGSSTADRYFSELPEDSENSLTDAARLQLVSTLTVTPEFNLLYFNPDAKVQVSDIDWIEIMSGMEGSSKSLGSTFDIPQYAYMNIHVHIEDDVVELVDKDDFSSPVGHEILSQAIKVEVYAPPTIHPPSIFLVLGGANKNNKQGISSAEIELPISHYDALGYSFYEASNVILHCAETNSPDVVSVNNTLDTNMIHLKVPVITSSLVRIRPFNQKLHAEASCGAVLIFQLMHQPSQAHNKLNDSKYSCHEWQRKDEDISV
ncbi:hypothetical protein GQ457_07G002330 [Hibiscus cannabinus]